jgi:hypothetical protein
MCRHFARLNQPTPHRIRYANDTMSREVSEAENADGSSRMAGHSYLFANPNRNSG